eukprot:UN33616
MDFFGNSKYPILISITLSGLVLEPFRNGFAFKHIGLLIFFRLCRSVSNGVWSLVDTLTLRLIEGFNEGYGRQRMFCTFAWGLGSVLVGLLMDQWGVNIIFWYTYFWIFCAVVLIVWVIPDSVTTNKNYINKNNLNNNSVIQTTNTTDLNASKNKKKKTNKLNLLINFLKDTKTCTFSLFVLSYFIIFDISEKWVAVQMTRDFDTSKNLIGISILVSCISEIPIFFYGDYWLGKFGFRSIILISYASMFIRLIACSFMTKELQNMILILQALHGLSFALPWLAYVNFLNETSPETFKATS